MIIAASRPILRLAEDFLARAAALVGGGPWAWWLSILTIGPLLGSFITEPAAMTICALLLSEKIYALNPGKRLRYGTLGLLFVNISVGGTLTHFAAPPVVMVAHAWDWGFFYMLSNFGWKAVIGILLSTALYYAVFRRELAALSAAAAMPREAKDEIPRGVTAVHVAFIGWTVLTAHYPPLVVIGFLFFLAYQQATENYQEALQIRGPLLVGFFLASLVIHGGCQQWWIEPVLGSLTRWPLMIGSTLLTAMNDNAAITYLASLVPSFTDPLKYAVMAGAVTGGGLTVIANAPNPAGQSILRARFGEEGISPLGLFLAAAAPTVIVGAVFMLL
jgi:Na+/H+ antiporter NhaD/arsenite permease-like protein